MDPATEQRLRTLAEQRSEAHRAFLTASERLGRVVASKPAPMAEIASVLGISRQACYALAEKWKEAPMSMDEVLNATDYAGDRTDLVAIYRHLQDVVWQKGPLATRASELLRSLRG